MSDTSRNRRDRHTDRPEGVTDPLLWGLALDVADAHQPDADGACQSLLCPGRAWPCETWHRAQQALRMAQSTPERRSTGSAPAPARWTGADAATGWSAEMPPAGRRLRSAVPPGGHRGSGAQAPAA